MPEGRAPQSGAPAGASPGRARQHEQDQTPLAASSTLAWAAAGVCAGAAVGRHAVDRLFAAAEEMWWSERLLPGFDLADGALFAGLAVLATLTLLLGGGRARPTRLGSAIGAALLAGAAVGLPAAEKKLDRLGREWFGPYGDRVLAGVEVAGVLVLVGGVLILVTRDGSTQRALPLSAAVVAAVALQALAPAAWLLPIAGAAFGAALLVSLAWRIRR